jgi:SHS2 domain-containing protein
VTVSKALPFSFCETDHTADYALLVRGVDAIRLFQNAAAGLVHLMGPLMGSKKDPAIRRRVRLDGFDREDLLVSWLEEFCFIAETEMHILVDCNFGVLTDHCLEAEIVLRPVAGFQRMVKAVTYHDLTIRMTDAGLETTIVFDV